MNLDADHASTRWAATFARIVGASRRRMWPVAAFGLILVNCPIGVAESLFWSQFRGPNAAGVVEGNSAVPSEFGRDQRLLLKVALPSGSSSPCIRGDHIFLTSYVESTKKLEVLCINRTSGQIKWRQTVPAKQIEKTHSSSNPATGTPAADDERVYVYFGSFGLLCYDHAGSQIWSIEQPIPETRNGSGTSPVIVGDVVLLNREERKESYLLAVDRKTGETVWKHAHMFRPGMMFEGYATPVIWGGQAIVHTHGGIRAIDVSSGELVWQVDANSTGCSTPVIGDGRLYVATWNNLGEPALRPEYPDFEELIAHDADGNGSISFDEFPRNVVVFDRPEARDEQGIALPMRFILGMFDANRDQELTGEEWKSGLQKLSNQITEHGLLSIQLGGTGDVSETHTKVLETTAIPEVPSPLYHDGRLYLIKRGGIVTCFLADSGKRLYRKRLSAAGSYYASPIAVGQRIFFTSAQGEVTVIKAADTLDVLAVNDLGERTLATPGVADGTIYFRTMDHLYAFGE